MNDFLVTELAREHQARLARAAQAIAMARAAEARGRPPGRHNRRLRLHPRND